MREVKASQLPYLECCSHWVQQPDEPDADTSARDAGIRQHKAVNDEETFRQLPEEEREAVVFCRDYITTNVKGHIDQDISEYKIQLEGLRPAYADRVVTSIREAYLIEYKFGMGYVGTAADNIQMQAYVLGVFLAFPDVQHITAILLTPYQIPTRASAKVYERDLIPTLQDKIYAIANEAKAEDGLFTPDITVCRRCGRKTNCPAIGSAALTIAKNLGLPMPSEFSPDKLVSVEDRAIAQQLREFFKVWGEEINKNNVKAVQENGIEIPGYSLIVKDGNR